MPGEHRLDADQVIQYVYDEDTNSLRVNTQATIIAGALEVAIDQSTDSIKIGDGTDLLSVNPDGSINVSAITGNISQGNPNTVDNAWPIKVTDGVTVATVTGSNALKVDGSSVTQPISAAGIPTALGQTTMANSMPVVLASNQTSINTLFDDTYGSLDSFNRLRVSYPTTIFDSQFQIDKQPVLWSESTATGGAVTFNTNTRSVDLSTTTSSGSSAIFQTRRHLRYNAGKSQIIHFTGNLGAGKTNTRKRFGFFDESNGVFFQLNDSTLSIVTRSSVSGSIVDTVVDQSLWNIDKLDGTGFSGLTLDISKQQIFVIDFQWLGSGKIRYGFDIDGKIHYCHIVYNANILLVPYSQTGNLPVRIEITNIGTTASSTTISITCCSIASECGYEPFGIMRSIDMNITGKVVASSSTLTPLLAIRKTSANVKMPLSLLAGSLYVGSADDVLFRFIHNPTLTGATFANMTNGIIESDVAATSFTGGTILHSLYVSGSANGNSTSLQDIFKDYNTWIGSDIAGNSDIILIAASSITTVATVFGTLTLREYT